MLNEEGWAPLITILFHQSKHQACEMLCYEITGKALLRQESKTQNCDIAQ